MLHQEASGRRLQIKFNWKIALCILILFSVLLRLGFWQLYRAQQKRRIQIDREALSLDNPVSVESLALDDINALKHMKVTLDGSYDNDKTILVSNQIYQNRPGYEVITVFKLRTSEQIVLISRGWIPVGYDSKQAPAIEPVSGIQHLVGEIHIPPSNAFFLPQKIDAPANWPLRLHHYDISDISELFDRPVLPFVVRLNENIPGVLERYWRMTRLQPVNSTSYAIQWFAMALILAVITFVKSTNILELLRANKANR